VGYGRGYGQLGGDTASKPNVVTIQNYVQTGQPAGQPSGDPGAESAATNALICSIIGLLCLPIVFSLIGLVKGVNAKERLVRAGEPTGTATAAIAIGVVGLVGGAIVALAYMANH
jgi:hypothetical protein